jgi:endo-alpha-1,4-polygalactosaminidase (GH114 family)
LHAIDAEDVVEPDEAQVRGVLLDEVHTSWHLRHEERVTRIFSFEKKVLHMQKMNEHPSTAEVSVRG